MGVFGKVKKHMILLLADEFLHTDLTLRDLLKTYYEKIRNSFK